MKAVMKADRGADGVGEWPFLPCVGVAFRL